MSQDGFKSWLDAMPVDELTRKIERLERKLADLRVLERLYHDRHPAEAEAGPQEGGHEGSGESGYGPTEH